MNCFLQFSKAQYTLEKKMQTWKNFLLTELGADEYVRFVLQKVISQSS